MLSLSEWLHKRAMEPIYESNIKSWESYLYRGGRFLPHNFIIERWFKGLPIRCGVVIGTLPPIEQSCSNAEIHEKATYGRYVDSKDLINEYNQKANVKSDFYDLTSKINKELYAVYKSICRHMRSNHLKSHTHCFNALCKTVTWNTENWEDGSIAVCEHAYAFILWRMYWENITIPRHLLMPSRCLRNSKFDYESKMDLVALNALNLLDAQKYDLHLWLILHFFALECLEVYKECILLANLMKRKNHFTWKVNDICGLYKGHWIIRDHEKGRPLELHWWLNHSYAHFMQTSKTSRKEHLGKEVQLFPLRAKNKCHFDPDCKHDLIDSN